MSDFVHLHLHTQYSILDGLTNIKKLVARAVELGMPAVAVTDHGNMYGAMTFWEEANKAKIKPILGCEVYVADGSRFDKGANVGERSRGFHLVLLAKNFVGYKNLCKLVSMGFRDGFYYNPRIDKEILEQHSDGLIASSACLAGEVAFHIRNGNVDRAEEAIKWYKGIFGDDYYLELMDHGIPDQKTVNEALKVLSKKHGVKLIATNDVHYLNAEDREAHDILICINTASEYDDPKRLRYSGQEYFKTFEEMSALFPDEPEAFANTLEIADKVEMYTIKKSHVILPVFPIPGGIDENEYLRELTYEGAKKKYGEELSDEVKERIEYELSVIKGMGFPGYFLIVQDFINKTKELGVMVGPGRGSAAGSAVAYCIGITDIDPLKYKLLFERFLNPERISMPDIDVDFDDEGREKVLHYVMDKYGADHVSQIVTFGTLACKGALRDVGRVFKMPLSDVDRLCKMIPDRIDKLADALRESQDLKKEYESGPEISKKVIKYAQQLEGAIRQTGVHACGVIIGPEDLTNHIPLATAKNSELMVTQFEGSQVESAGMLKMDFLGLKTLSILRDAIINIKDHQGVDVDLDNIPLDDAATFKLFQDGTTVGIFQFESPGMQRYLRELVPESMEDLIAMNALYRPGPMDNIPLFIDRKHGREKIEYPHPLLEKVLKDTYGIMVYQEQIMQTAQICAGFSLAKADILRKAMGKKKLDVMEAMKNEFIEGCQKNNDIDNKKAADIFDIMVKFASYGFNRSHAAAYSVVAYQTAYLKAHYPAEYMASVLTHDFSDLKKITFFIDECKRMGLIVDGPNVNDSNFNFTVNKSGHIVFGLAGIKGVGMAVVEEITKERDQNGPFKDVLDFIMRVNINKKSIESLVATGAFDSFPNVRRSQFFYAEKEGDPTFLDILMRYAAAAKSRKESPQVSLFGETIEEEDLPIEFPKCEEFSLIQKLKLEKDNIGFYLSGHPLDQYAIAIKYFANGNIKQLKKCIDGKKKASNFRIAAMITEVSIKTSAKGSQYARYTLEDYEDSVHLMAFTDEFLKINPYLVPGQLIMANGAINCRKYKDNEEYVFNVSGMTSLESVLNKCTKKVVVNINSSDVSKEFADTLYKRIKECKGECPLTLKIFDVDLGYYVDTKYADGGVDVSAFCDMCRKYNYNVSLL